MTKSLVNSHAWVQRCRVHDERAPILAIRDVRIRASKKKGYFEISVRGVGFRPWAVPPVVRVNGKPVAALRFSKDGRAIRGLIRSRSRRYEVEVDLGFARARWSS